MATTQVQTRQIADGAIDNSKIASGANIASNKLADGSNFLKKDGSVALTGNLALGTNRITGVGTPSTGTDGANKDYVDTAVSQAITPFVDKGKARAASTANLTLSGTQTIDGVSVVAGDRVLVKNQTTAAQNGVYVVAAGAWARSLDMDAWSELIGAYVVVQEGTTQADTFWLCTPDKGGTLETTAVTFINPFSGVTSFGNANFVDKEVPTGSINGANTTFTLANTPTAGTEHLYLNGILQESGSGNDYTISGASLTFLAAPLTGEKIRVSYRR